MRTTVTLDVILNRMNLTHPGDKALLLKLIPWIQTQRPKFMYTSVLSIAVLLQRMARAFSMRSSAPGNNNNNSTTKALPPPHHQHGQQQQQQQQQQQPQQPIKKKKKRKAFRSAKKLDLSPNVVASLKGFVADLAATIPLIVEYVQQQQQKQRSSSSALTAVDTIEVCLHMMEGEVATNQPPHPSTTTTTTTTNNNNNNHKSLPNAAMELYRKILDRAISNNNNNNKQLHDGMASTMDQLKFKTFCIKTLESAQSRAISVVEALYDFRFFWNHVLLLDQHQQHQQQRTQQQDVISSSSSSSSFFSIFEQQKGEEMAWKLAFYIVWKRQEEHPNLCTRRERILAATTSMIILFTFPHLLVEQQQQQQKLELLELEEEKNRKNATTTTTTNTDNNNNNNKKRPLLETTTATTTTTTIDSNTTSSPPSKVPRVESNSIKGGMENDGEGDVHNATSTPTSTTATATATVTAAASKTEDRDEEEKTTKQQQIVSSIQQQQHQQERTMDTILRASKHASSFLKWAEPKNKDLWTEMERKEVEEELLKVVTELAAFSNNNNNNNNQYQDDAPDDNISSSSNNNKNNNQNWIECIKSALGMKQLKHQKNKQKTEGDDDEDGKTYSSTTDTINDAVKNLLSILDAAFYALQRDEDERMGTRVEAVPYIEELDLMKEVRRGHHMHLCKTTTKSDNNNHHNNNNNEHQRERSDLIACVPVMGEGGGGAQQDVNNNNNSNARKGSSDMANITEYQARAMHPRMAIMMEEDPHNHNFITHHHNGSVVSPPVMTEPMELNEWTIAILSSLKQIRPSPNLISLLDPNNAAKKTEVDDGVGVEPPPTNLTKVIVPLLNRFLRRMVQVATLTGGGGSKMPPDGMPMTIDEADGQVRTYHRTQETQLWAAIVQLYYHSLESLLFFEVGAAGSAAVKNAPFHEALMACSYLCVARAVTITGKMQLVQPEHHQVYSILPLVGATPYTYLKVTESFVRALTSTIPGNDTSTKLVEIFGKLPRILQREVVTSEVHVIESLLWVRDSSRSMAEGCIVNTIAELKQNNFWPPESLEPNLPEELEYGVGTTNKERPRSNHAEFTFVEFVIRKLLRIAKSRIQSILPKLGVSAKYPVLSQVWLAFRFLLRNHIELLYGRHVDQWILCTIYGICKIMKFQPDITFGKAITAYTSLRGSELGATTCEAIVRHVKILDAAGGNANDNDGDQGYGSTKMGNIVNLYNLVFVPIMKSFMLNSKSLKRDAATLKREMAKEKGKENSAHDGDSQSKGENVSKETRRGNVIIRHEDRNERAENWEPSQSTFLKLGRHS